MNRCRSCGGDTRDGNCSPLYPDLCANCADELVDAQEAAETLAAEAFAEEDAAVRRFRQQAADAIQVQDWPAFFAAAADCARAMNARGRIVDQAPVVGFAATLTPRGEAAEVAA